MITYDEGTNRFNYRIVGVAVEDDHVLLHHESVDDFWALPGGRAELQEDAMTTVKRELGEEIGAVVQVGRLLWIAEDFFHYKKMHYHEIALYFFMTFPEDSPFRDKTRTYPGIESDVALTYKWFPTSELKDLSLYPSFLARELQSLPDTPRHILHNIHENRPMKAILRS